MVLGSPLRECDAVTNSREVLMDEIGEEEEETGEEDEGGGGD